MPSVATVDRQGHVDALTGVRAIAAGWVVAYHLWLNAGHPPLVLPLVHLDVVPLVTMGWLGVDIFFILSGFVLTWQVLNERRLATFSRASFWHDAGLFLRRRVLRVYPAYLACLSVLLPFAWLGIYRTPPALADVSLHLAMFHNLDMRYVDSINGVFWSMPFEWQFYLIFPLLILPILQRKTRWLLLGAVGVAVIVKLVSAWNGPGPERAQLPWRIDEFVVGMAAAAIAVRSIGSAAMRSRMTWFAAVALIGGAWIIGSHDPLWWQPGAMPILRGAWIDIGVASLLIGVCGSSATALSRLLASRVMVWLGTISYSVYLWHVPTLELTHRALLVHDIALPRLAIVGILIAAILGVSALSYYAVERPFHSPTATLNGRWRNPGLRAMVVGTWIVAIFIIAATMTVLTSSGAIR
ncbi:MAG: acyltransferase [Betaproteobacteria bacterium]